MSPQLDRIFNPCSTTANQSTSPPFALRIARRRDLPAFVTAVVREKPK